MKCPKCGTPMIKITVGKKFLCHKCAKCGHKEKESDENHYD